jgi:hypothetical protein
MIEPLELYLTFERLMLQLDNEGDEDLADGVRDLMDRVWYRRLTANNRDQLNARQAIDAADSPTLLYFVPRSKPAATLRGPIHTEIPYLKKAAS